MLLHHRGGGSAVTVSIRACRPRTGSLQGCNVAAPCALLHPCGRAWSVSAATPRRAARQHRLISSASAARSRRSSSRSTVEPAKAVQLAGEEAPEAPPDAPQQAWRATSALDTLHYTTKSSAQDMQGRTQVTTITDTGDTAPPGDTRPRARRIAVTIPPDMSARIMGLARSGPAAYEPLMHLVSPHLRREIRLFMACALSRGRAGAKRPHLLITTPQRSLAGPLAAWIAASTVGPDTHVVNIDCFILAQLASAALECESLPAAVNARVVDRVSRDLAHLCFMEPAAEGDSEAEPVALRAAVMTGGGGVRSLPSGLGLVDVFRDATGDVSSPQREALVSLILAVVDHAHDLRQNGQAGATNSASSASTRVPTLVHVDHVDRLLDDTTGVGDMILRVLHDIAESRRAEGQPMCVFATAMDRSEFSSTVREGRRAAYPPGFQRVFATLPLKDASLLNSSSAFARVHQDAVVCMMNVQRELQRYVGREAAPNVLAWIDALVEDGIFFCEDGPVCWTEDVVNRLAVALAGLHEQRQEANKRQTGRPGSFETAKRGPGDGSDPSSSAIAATLTLDDFRSVYDSIDKNLDDQMDRADTLDQAQAEMEHPDHRDGDDEVGDEFDDEPVEPDAYARHLGNANVASGLGEYEKKLVTRVTNPDSLTVTFDDVCLPAAAKDVVKMHLTLPITHPHAFTYGVLKHNASSGMLFFGPPGTGKTMLAKAIAKESGAKMITIRPSDLMNKYVGESEKLIRAMFSLARKLAPCIIFIDEIDSLLNTRSDADQSWRRNFVNEFMLHWEGLDSAGDRMITVMGSTNRPFDLDEAVLRRLPQRMLLDLPTETDRLAILSTHLQGEVLDPSVDLAAIAKTTGSYSGSDLRNVCVTAAMAAMQEIMSKSQDTVRVLRKEHFDRALLQVAPSISNEMTTMKRLREWDKQFGSNRASRRPKSKVVGFGSLLGDSIANTDARVR